MQYLRARYYLPAQGIFNRLDPFFGNQSDPQSLHKYAYVHGDPVNGIDPSGLYTLGSLMAQISIKTLLISYLKLGLVGAAFQTAIAAAMLIPLIPFYMELKGLSRDLRGLNLLPMQQGMGYTFAQLADANDVVVDAVGGIISNVIIGGAVGVGFAFLLGGLPPFLKGLKIGFNVSYGAVTTGLRARELIAAMNSSLRVMSFTSTLMGRPLCMELDLRNINPRSARAIDYWQLIQDAVNPASVIRTMRESLASYSAGDIGNAHSIIDGYVDQRTQAYGSILRVSNWPCP